MKLKLLFTLLFVIVFQFSNGQNALWKPISQDRVSTLEKFERASNPSSFLLYELNLTLLKSSLTNAPRDLSGINSNVILNFPNQKGQLENFLIYEAPIMEDGLAERYPDIKAYIGKGITDPTASIRFTITLFGLHVMSTSGDAGTFYIDTYTKDLSTYIVYSKKSLSTTRTFTCLNVDEVDQMAGRVLDNINPNSTSFASDGLFRQYRLAMACTIEYATFHVNAAGLGSGTLAQKKAAVLAAMNITMARVNGIYERDMSLRMNLVANNDLVIFIDSDTFSNADAGALINESQTVIDANIGSANYDIGHTVSTGGGGLAQLNSPCTANKARGITGSPSPVGDAYDVDYVAHEMGHQFGGTHTFNNSCGGNRSNSTAVEPGSGSTIMAYAGICTPNVQSNSDAHFHAVSIAQMSSFVAGTGSCAASSSNSNNAPVVNAGIDWTIPQGTPFILTGSATDANNDSLTYCWEQTNTDISTQAPLQTSTIGPNFRSNPPIASPSRYMPSLSSVLANNLAPTWEVIPTVARTMDFALTVRDNRTPNGGQTGRDNTTITFSSIGPFDVTSQNTDGISWTQGSSQTITWAVNSTNTLVGSANVDILLSTDGGLTYPTVLVSNTPNDGSQVITVPNVAATSCRVMVKPTGNIYYDINSKSFSIGYTVSNVCTTYTNNSALTIPDGLGSNIAGATVNKIISVPVTGVLTDVNITLSGTHTYFWDLVVGLTHPNGSTQTRLLNRNCNQVSSGFSVVFNDASPAIVCAANLSGTFAPAQPLNVFNGLVSNGTWTLWANDNWNGDTGVINNWSLELCYNTYTLQSESFGLNNFNLYPNPNNGSFTVQFDSQSSNDVLINIHDLRGRQVFSKTYQNNGVFNQTLQLENVFAGVYLVTVQNGTNKEVKKIIIE